MIIIGAFITSLLIFLLFVPYHRRRGSSLGALLLFFFILFLAGIATPFWIVPFGPIYWGISWLPLFFMILIFALLFSARPSYQNPKKESDTADEAAAFSIGIFFWILLCLLIGAILWGVFR
jgi:hypothetical protein